MSSLKLASPTSGQGGEMFGLEDQWFGAGYQLLGCSAGQCRAVVGVARSLRDAIVSSVAPALFRCPLRFADR